MNRVMKDRILQGITYLSASIAILILVLILGFIFYKGLKVFSLDFITSPYAQQSRWVLIDSNNQTFTEPKNLGKDVVWSDNWGVGLKQYTDKYGHIIIEIVSIAKDSPLNGNIVVYINGEPSTLSFKLQVGQQIARYKTTFKKVATDVNQLTTDFNSTNQIFFEDVTPGGGIWGSLLTTIIMIITTLIVAIPFGVSIAIYLSEYSRKNRIILIMKSMIDMLAGVPSIVFGLAGMLVFFRIIGTGGPVLIGGSATMVAILLPVIIRATEEALLTVPQSLRQASLALGANKTQTIFKIVVPTAMPGILTATILSIGRIVGESAALILVSGTFMNDNPSLMKPGATLAVQIWSIMAGDQPNIPMAAAISILIILLVLVLNILLKIVSKKLNRY